MHPPPENCGDCILLCCKFVLISLALGKLLHKHVQKKSWNAPFSQSSWESREKLSCLMQPQPLLCEIFFQNFIKYFLKIVYNIIFFLSSVPFLKRCLYDAYVCRLSSSFFDKFLSNTRTIKALYREFWNICLYNVEILLYNSSNTRGFLKQKTRKLAI